MRVSTPRYQQIARQVGDKLPSVRMLSQELAISINTIQQAYYCLEVEGLVEARPQSGYYWRCQCS